MAKEKASCLKKLLLGCGCFTVAFILLGIGIASFIAMNEPLPPEFEVISVEQIMGDPEEKGLNLPGEDSPMAKPICLKVDVGKTRFSVVPDSGDHKITISGNFDKANYDLKTEITEGEDCIEYVVTFKDKGSFFANNDGDNNELILHLPRNLPIDLDLDMSMGALDMDLTGVPLLGLKLDTKMTVQEIRMATPNPIKATNFRVETRMGSSRIEDIQNFRFEEGSIKSSMGDVKIYNSGPLAFDTKIYLKMSMGEVFFQAPESSRLKSSFDCTMGEYEGPKQIKNPDAPLLTLSGKCSMGRVRVVTGLHKPLFTNIMYQVWLETDIENAIDLYLHELKDDTEKYRFGRHELRTLGYRLLDSGHPEDALVIFEINAKEYPDYHKTHRALAAAKWKLGHPDEALEDLEKALDIDPSYNSALRMKRKILEELEKVSEGEPY